MPDSLPPIGEFAEFALTAIQAERETAQVIARAKRPRPAPGEFPEPSQLMLPFWHDNACGLPNPLLRSALFGALNRQTRQALFQAPIKALKGISILYTGWQLDQTDLDVYMQALMLARTSPLGTKVEFEEAAFLKAIGRDTGRGDRRWLHRALTRLCNATIEVAVEGQSWAYFGNLLYGGFRSLESGRYVIALNPDLLHLFGDDGWTRIHWRQRQRLKGHPIALWLHSSYSTHAEPLAYRFDTLQALCGSRTKRVRDFKADLLVALDLLREVCGWSWDIEGNTITIRHPLTPAQARHVNRKA